MGECEKKTPLARTAPLLFPEVTELPIPFTRCESSKTGQWVEGHFTGINVAFDLIEIAPDEGEVAAQGFGEKKHLL